jgi:phosphoribosylformylglycinamidine cyclo-ligase
MITYKNAGVDIDAGNALVDRIKKFAPRIGGFSDGILLPKGYKEPVLIGCTDGVGTKLAIAQTLKIHNTIGYDLVGMNVNDLICSGARPLFFLDYFASGKLNVDVAETVVKSIAKACRESDCELIGGETAEMPGFYKPGEYDLAGFATGVVERKKMLTPKETTKAGDLLLAIPSSGLHSNGYSLVRKVFPQKEWRKLASILLAPTRLYVRPVLRVLARVNGKGKWGVKGAVHVTGGGFTDNIPRVLPNHLSAEIKVGTWKTPWVFQEIQRRSKLTQKEMFWTFNNGVGMVLVIDPKVESVVKKMIPDATIIGRLIKGKRDVLYV